MPWCPPIANEGTHCNVATSWIVQQFASGYPLQGQLCYQFLLLAPHHAMSPTSHNTKHNSETFWQTSLARDCGLSCMNIYIHCQEYTQAFGAWVIVHNNKCLSKARLTVLTGKLLIRFSACRFKNLRSRRLSQHSLFLSLYCYIDESWPMPNIVIADNWPRQAEAVSMLLLYP